MPGGSKIMKERSDPRVSLVDLVPERSDVSRLQVARDEGGLAGARRTLDPDGRTRSRLVQPAEQPLAWENRNEARCCDLRERRLRWMGLRCIRKGGLRRRFVFEGALEDEQLLQQRLARRRAARGIGGQAPLDEGADCPGQLCRNRRRRLAL